MSREDIILHLINKYTKDENIENLLDLGCGEGELTVKVAKTVECKNIFGVDIDRLALQKAERKGIRTFIADLNSDTLPFPEGTFDLVLMTEVIEHLYDVDHALMEVRRVLKHNGYLLLSTPNLAGWLNRFVLLFGYQPYLTNVSLKYDVGKLFRKNMETGCKGQHIRVFTLKALKELLKLYGFKIVCVKGATVQELPKIVRIIDRIISLIPSLSMDVVVLAQKSL